MPGSSAASVPGDCHAGLVVLERRDQVTLRPLSVVESEIETAFRDLGRHGIGAGYESAATLAALRQARRSSAIAAGARVLLLLTGSQLIPLGKSK